MLSNPSPSGICSSSARLCQTLT